MRRRAATELADGRCRAGGRGGRRWPHSLYINNYNTVARAFDRIGFEQIGTFAAILLD